MRGDVILKYYVGKMCFLNSILHILNTIYFYLNIFLINYVHFILVFYYTFHYIFFIQLLCILVYLNLIVL